MARYALTILISAFLLFQLQPLIAKYLLPWFGGGPAIWTTCMLFFQVLLLAGYLYAHLLSVKLSMRRQGVVHLSLVIASLALLPIAPSEHLKPTGGEAPVAKILLLLLATVGGPYAVLSSTGPLMQRWFSRSFAEISPYRLYAISNFGSFLALVSYPLLFEPMLTLRAQAWIWSGTYAVFAALTVCCAVRAMRSEDDPSFQPSRFEDAETAGSEPTVRPTAGRMLLWLGLSAMGSTMLLATTNQMCIDVAVVPFLWVLPLSLYLLTFVICFDNPRWYDRRVFGLLLILAAALACWHVNQGLVTTIPALVSVYSVVMVACCMTCHGELVKSRPHPRYLTLFYLLVSTGGALGGVFVAIVSPTIFTGFWEYHVALGGTCLVTLIAWCSSQVWLNRCSAGFWTSTIVSAAQVFAVIELVFRKHSQSFSAGDASLLFGGVGLIHLVGWLVMADRERQAKRWAVVWTTVTFVQFAWVIGLVETRVTGTVGKGQYVVLALSCLTTVALGVSVIRLVEQRVSETMWRWILAVGLQPVLLIGLAVLTIVQTISIGLCAAMIAVYVVLNVIGIGFCCASAKSFLRVGTWFWAPAATACVLLAVELYRLTREDSSESIYTSRSFYGVLHVSIKEDVIGQYYSLTHGRIEHGNQYLDEDWRLQPTTYYGAGTGIDMAMRLHPRRLADEPDRRSLRVGVVGLGTGSIAAHGKPDDVCRFYEINPDVVALANQYFSYLRDSQAKTEVVIGDARVVLDRELASGISQQFDVLVIDAFSSDAIPVHLITRECADLYKQHIKDDGLLLFHISNRFLDLNPVTRALARHLGWQAVCIDTDDDEELGVYGATWVIISANERFVSLPEIQDAHCPQDVDSAPLLWTDDFASLWRVISYEQ